MSPSREKLRPIQNHIGAQIAAEDDVPGLRRGTPDREVRFAVAIIIAHRRQVPWIAKRNYHRRAWIAVVNYVERGIGRAEKSEISLSVAG